MESMLSRFVNLPGPAKAGFALMGGVGLLGVAFLLLGDYPFALAILIGGVMFAGLIFIMFRKVLKKRKKRKAAPLQQNIEANSAVAPQGVNAPEQRASMDDLRKNFQTGLDKFNAAGKDLYSLPWYVLVGEPGSGKTEAIRHCSVGFPPGLQDQLQGSGGTINMNWWFTNHAVILDTAGRLMFEDIEPGKVNEWKEFLKLLRTYRPNCPINGMLLTIPANSIVKDNANEIEAKAGKIANQLDQIQRELGVRFPVTIIITKSDLIYGFREYFDDITNPQLQHQIMGWSNPAELDEPFRPENVKDCLMQVKQSIVGRRLSLLQDPVNTEDPDARRMDQVDSLYSFPEGFEQIMPRLQRYLEMIFVAGEWSAKPLFLRGIYFTSSMREGSALDADLAEALNVSIDSLPEGKVWERERAYFLRDLFMDKVFKEKGLVTRAGNAKKLQRRRRMVVMGFGFVSVLIFAALTIYFSIIFKNNLGEHVNFWTALKTDYIRNKTKEWHPIGEPIYTNSKSTKFGYWGRNALELENERGDVKITSKKVKIHGDIKDNIAKEKIDPPWIFIWARLSDDLNVMRTKAARVLYKSAVLNSLPEMLYRKMEEDTSNGVWSEQATGALVQMIRLEAWSAGLYNSSEAQNINAGELIDLSKLYDYVFMDYAFREDNDENNKIAARSDFVDDIESLQEILNWLYSLDENAEEWQGVAESLVNHWNQKDLRIVSIALDGFIKSWESDKAGLNDEFTGIVNLCNSLGVYSSTETALLGVDNGSPELKDEYIDLKENWIAQYGDLGTAAENLKEDVKFLGERDLTALYKSARKDILEKAETQFSLIRKEIHPAYISADSNTSAVAVADGDKADDRAGSENVGLPAEFSEMEARLDDAERKFKLNYSDIKLTEKVEELEAYKENILNTSKDNERVYRVRYDWYTRVTGFINNDSTDSPVDLSQEWLVLASGINNLNLKRTEVLAAIDKQSKWPAMKDYDITAEAQATAVNILGAASKAGRYEIVNKYLAEAPESVEEYEMRALQYVDKSSELNHIERPIISMCNELQSEEDIQSGNVPLYNSSYHPEVVRIILKNWGEVENCVASDNSGNAINILEHSQLKPIFDSRDIILQQYLDNYVNYWTNTVERDTSVKRYDDWETFHKDLKYVRASSVNNKLKSIAERQLKALEAVPDAYADNKLQKYKSKINKEINELDDEEYHTQCGKVADSWYNLSDNASEARYTLLKTNERNFLLNYIAAVNSGGQGNSPNIRYWDDLTLCAIQTLAKSSEKDAQNSIDRLKEDYRKFPLSKTADGDKELSLTEINEAHNLLSNITSLSISVNQDKNTNLVGTKDTLKGLGDISNAINNLRTINMSDEDTLFVKGLKAVINGLPYDEEDEEYTCKVWVTAGSAAAVWREIGLVQVNGGKYRESVRLDTIVELGVLKYPGGEVRVELFESSNLDKTIVIKGNWSCIKLLHNYPSRRMDKSGKKWEVDLPVERDGSKYVIKLQLDFDRALPRLRDWPE